MIHAPVLAAQASNSSLRGRDSITPKGHWCDGVTTARRARGERLARPKIAGVFKPHRIAGGKQRSCKKTHGTLIPGGNQDLICRTPDPARNCQIPADRLTQRSVTSRILGHHCDCGKSACPTRDETRPELTRKLVEGRQAHLKRARRLWPNKFMS